MTLDRLESQEVQDTVARWERELRNWPDLDPQIRIRIQDAIARARSMDTLTSSHATEELQREVNSLESSLAGLIRVGSRMGGMERMPSTPDIVPEISISRERELIQRRLERHEANPTLSNEQIALLARRVGELDALEQPVPTQDVVEHPEFERVVRAAHTRLRGEGKTGDIPLFGRESLKIVRQGLLHANGELRNAYSKVNPLGGYANYQFFLKEGVVRDAVSAARRAILSQRVPRPTNIDAILQETPHPTPSSPDPVQPPTAPPTATPPISTSVAPDAPEAPAASPQAGAAAPTSGSDAGQSGAIPNAAAGTDQLHPQLARLAEEISKKGGNVNLNIIGDIGINKNTGAIPGVMPHAPANAPAAHGHAETAPGNAARGGHEATPQGQEALIKRYWEVNAQEDAAFAELKAHIDLPDRKEKLAALERLREQRKAVFDQFAVPFGGREAALQMARREIAAEAAERGQNAPTAGEARNALGAIHGRTRAEAARIIAAKSGGSEKWIRRFLSAPARWSAAIVSGMATGVVGYSFAQSGLAGGISSLATSLGVPAGWLGAGALGSIPATVGGVAIPFIGGMALPAVPVVAAALAGIAVWQLGPRKWLGFKKLDDFMDKGWQAKKLHNKMRVGDSEAAINAKYAKISSRPTWRRMQTIPRIFGTLLGGMTMHDITTGALSSSGFSSKSVLKSTSSEAVDLVKGAWEKIVQFWNNPKAPEWLQFGGEVQRAQLTECQSALQKLQILEPELRKQIAGLEGANKSIPELDRSLGEALEKIKSLETLLAQQPSNPTVDGSELIATRVRVAELEEQLQRSREQLEAFKRAGTIPPVEELDMSRKARSEIAPRGPSSPGLEAPSLLRLKPSDLSFVIDQNSDVKNIPQGLRKFFESIGFKGPSTEWLIDTIDKTTYNGNGVRGGQDVMRDLTGGRFRPTTIPDGTTVDVAQYLEKGMNAQNLYARIESSKILTYPEKTSMTALVEKLEEVARRGR